MSDRDSSSATLLDEEELSAMTDPELLAYEREQVGARRDPRARRQQLNAVSKWTTYESLKTSSRHHQL
jgi:hypothetical protein